LAESRCSAERIVASFSGVGVTVLEVRNSLIALRASVHTAGPLVSVATDGSTVADHATTTTAINASTAAAPHIARRALLGIAATGDGGSARLARSMPGSPGAGIAASTRASQPEAAAPGACARANCRSAVAETPAPMHSATSAVTRYLVSPKVMAAANVDT